MFCFSSVGQVVEVNLLCGFNLHFTLCKLPVISSYTCRSVSILWLMLNSPPCLLERYQSKMLVLALLVHNMLLLVVCSPLLPPPPSLKSYMKPCSVFLFISVWSYMDFSLVCVCVVRMRPLQPSMPSESALTMSILYTHCTLDLVSRLRCIAAPSASVALCYLRGHCLARKWRLVLQSTYRYWTGSFTWK